METTEKFNVCRVTYLPNHLCVSTQYLLSLGVCFMPVQILRYLNSPSHKQRNLISWLWDTNHYLEDKATLWFWSMQYERNKLIHGHCSVSCHISNISFTAFHNLLLKTVIKQENSVITKLHQLFQNKKISAFWSQYIYWYVFCMILIKTVIISLRSRN